MIACIKREKAVLPKYACFSIPAQIWAVFSVEWDRDSPVKIHDTWQRIYSEWFPSINYEHADCDFDMEIYFGNQQSEYGVDIWIPVVKNNKHEVI